MDFNIRYCEIVPQRFENFKIFFYITIIIIIIVIVGTIVIVTTCRNPARRATPLLSTG